MWYKSWVPSFCAQLHISGRGGLQTAQLFMERAVCGVSVLGKAWGLMVSLRKIAYSVICARHCALLFSSLNPSALLLISCQPTDPGNGGNPQRDRRDSGNVEATLTNGHVREEENVVSCITTEDVWDGRRPGLQPV